MKGTVSGEIGDGSEWTFDSYQFQLKTASVEDRIQAISAEEDCTESSSGSGYGMVSSLQATCDTNHQTARILISDRSA